MSIFKIIKKAPNSFWHLYNNGSKEVNLSDFEVVLDLIAQTFNIQCLNGANIPNQSVQIANIIVIDQTDGSLEETFSNVIALKNRLTTLGYTPYKSSTGIEEAPVDGNTYGRKDEGWIIITGGGGGNQTLSEVLAEGNTTGGENIVINNADSIELENTSSLKKGTYNFGGNGGISRICSNNYEDMWQNGFRHVFDQSGFIRNSTNCFDIIPDETFDDTLRFKVGSIWTLDNGTSYVCTDTTTGAAVWELQGSGTTLTLQEVLDNNHDLVDNNNFQGTGAGIDNTGAQVNAFGFNAARENIGQSINAIGVNTCYQNTGDAVNALGDSAAQNNTGIFVNALGQDAANANTGTQVNALGTESAGQNTGTNVNALGNGAAGLNIGNNVNALGDNAGYENIANNVNAIGAGAARSNSGDQVNAFGVDSCFENTGGLVNAFGTEAGYQNTGNNSNFLGEQAGEFNTGEGVNAMGAAAGLNNTFNNVNLFGQSATADEDGQTVLSKDGTIMARISTTDLTATRKYNLPDASGTLALTSDVNTPTLQQVTDEGNETTNFIKVVDTGESEIRLEYGGLNFNDLSDGGSTFLRFQNTSIPNQEVEIRPLSGTMALLSDITTPTLQDVTDEGNTTTNDVKVNSLGLYSNPNADYGYLSWDGDNGLVLKDHLTQVLFKADKGGSSLSFVNNDDFTAKLDATLLTDNRNFVLPDVEGTIALTSDIPTLVAGTNITIDDTDPLNPIISSSGAGGGIPHATATGTDTYTATVTGVTSYADGDAYLIRFTNGNTSGATLNINSLGAITLYRNNDGVLIGGDIISGGEMICVYNSTTNGFQCIGTAPNSLFSYVTNADSVTLTKGMPVYAFSGTGDRMTVKRANNTGDATSAQTVGLVLSTSIAANQKGLIMMQGLLDGLSILPTSTFADGDTIYLGATAGTITNVKPYAPNHLVYLGVVTTASNGSAGRMYVRVQNGYELSEIHDVDLITNAPTNNQALIYESSTDLWKNKTIIQDSITDGVTTVAPSQNAVFDALALKQNALSFTPYKFIQTSQTAHTGTTAETILATATIAGGTFNSSDVMKMFFGINKTLTNGAYTIRLRINTSNTLTGATQIALFSTGATTAQNTFITRNFSLNGGNLIGYSFTTSSLTDTLNTGGAVSSTTYNTANTLYVFFTVTLTNSSDTISFNTCNIFN